MINIPLGTIIRNPEGMKFGKYNVPKNVYLAISELPSKKCKEYTATVIKYKKDKNSQVHPRLGFQLLISDYNLEYDFEIITKIKSIIFTEKIGGELKTGCDTSTVSKNTKINIYKKWNSNDVIKNYKLYSGNLIYQIYTNIHFKIESHFESKANGASVYTIWMHPLQAKHDKYKMVIHSDHRIVVWHSKNIHFCTVLSEFRNYFVVKDCLSD